MPLASLKRVLAASLLAAGLVATAGCSTFGWGKDKEEEFAKDSPEKIYRDAQARPAQG